VAAGHNKAYAGRRLLRCNDPDTIDLGASISHAGVCLTVVERSRDGSDAELGHGRHVVDISSETLARSTAGQWSPGARINLERSLTLGDELGGHLVTGHIDGVGLICEREEQGDTVRFAIEVPVALSRFIAEKGSVALDGTSLTVNAVQGNRFSIMLIPHSLAVTTWGAAQAGDRVNVEVDLMARYAARLMDYDTERDDPA
ncbi:MAG: riboflavin synthase, partial [Pseudomonadota bacterium]